MIRLNESENRSEMVEEMKCETFFKEQTLHCALLDGYVNLMNRFPLEKQKK